MKTRLWFIAGLLLGMVAGCQDEQYETSQSDDVVRVYADDLDPATRVIFTEDGNVTHASWTEGDRIGIYAGDQCNLEYAYETNENGLIEFRYYNEGLENVEGTKVYAYYHRDGNDQYDLKLPLRDPVMRWGSDGIRPLLYAHSEIRNGEVHLQFKHAFAYLKVTVTREAIEPFVTDPRLALIRISAQVPISVTDDTRFDVRAEQFTGELSDGMETGVDNYDFSEGPYSLYVPIVPVEEGGSVITISLKAAEGAIGFPRTIPQDGFQAGHVYSFSTSKEEIVELREEQRQALIDLYNATDGPNWGGRKWTDFTLPFYQWPGVNLSTDNQDGYIVRLELEDNGLINNLPESFTTIMDYAQTIVLRDNAMSGVVPQCIRSHPRWKTFGWDIIKQKPYYNGKLSGGIDMTDINLQLHDETVEYLYPEQGTTTILELLKKNKLTFIDINTPGDANLNTYLSYRNKGLGLIIAHQSWGGTTREAAIEAAESHPINEWDNNIVRLWRSLSDGDLSGISVLGSTYLLDSEGNLVDYVMRDWNLPDEYYTDRLDSILYARLGNPEDHPPFSSEEIYYSTNYEEDGKVITLQEASVGKGIDLVFMGDAYVDRDMDAGGKYETAMKTAMETFFSIEPYQSFRNRFNVYAVKVVSKTEYIIADADKRDNRINLSDDICFEYAGKVPGVDLNEVTIVNVVNNPNEFFSGGYTHMFEGKNATVAHIEQGGPSAGVIIHEAGGHGFAKLLDEYLYEEAENVTATESDKAYYDAQGWGANIDFTDSRDDIKWAHMLKDTHYSGEVDIYEGAYLWGHGVWRSTESSIMHNANWLWFNAPSREAIYKAIMKASEGDGWTYDFEDFATYDVINRTSTNTRAASGVARDKRKVIHKAPVIIRESQGIVPFRN